MGPFTTRRHAADSTALWAGNEGVSSGLRPRPRFQFELQRLEFLGEIADLVKLVPDRLHLFAVQVAEGLNQDGDRLLELVEHLLLHEAELVDDGDQQRLADISAFKQGRLISSRPRVPSNETR